MDEFSEPVEAGDFSHSLEGSEVLPKFYDKEITVFVEGQDDIWFWAPLFERIGRNTFHFESVGGYEQLEKRISEVIHNKATFVVACDCDFTCYFSDQPKHVRIVRTYGYSIENTLYCSQILDLVAQKLSRSRDSHKEIIDKYISYFENDNRRLIIFDLANKLNAKGIQLECENCCRFLKSSNSPYVDEAKLEAHLKKFVSNFSLKELEEAESLIGLDPRPKISIMRGHFVTHAAINWIKAAILKKHSKHQKLSLETLYLSVIGQCAYCRKKCVQTDYHLESISNALKSFSAKAA